MKKTLLLSFLTFLLINTLKAQNTFNFNCAKDTVVDCNQTCITLTTKVPDVRSFSDDYGVNLTSGPGGCFRPPISPATPGTSTNLDRDDLYTPVIPMPFDFPFYGIIYAQLIVNTNGIISFDLAEASNGAQWSILNGEPSLPTTAYDRAIIMGAYHDIDIQFPNTSPTKQIKYDVVGTAPHRKWILSFYKVPCYQNTCWPKINNTYQITLYEGLGLVDIHVWGREICNSWNNGNAMIGMQNYDRDKGIMAPGREAWTNPRWGSPTMNESWRFTPKVGPTLFKKVELTDLAGNFVANGDTVGNGNNELDVSFNNVCLNTSTQYVVKTHYYNFQYPFQFPASDSIIYATDTIRVSKAGSVPPINLSTTQAQCGANPNGSITITSPIGVNFEYSVDGGVSYQASPNFSVPAGTYTVTVHEISGSCTRDTTVTITAPTTLSGTATSTNTACPEALNGSITITGNGGTGSYTYAVDNLSAPVFVASNIFTGLTAGDHTVLVKDGAGCIFTFTHNISSDPVFTTSGSAVNASCLGALNGSLTVTVPSSGQAPFAYSIPGGVFGTYQPSPTFSGLAGDSTYTVNVRDNLGCVFAFTQPVGYNPGVTSTATIRNASCLGINNGYIVLNPSGGTAPYFYQLDTGSAPVFVALDTLRNLGAGLYDVTIRDNTGCLFNLDDISIASGSGVSATFTVRPAACSTANTGSIAFNTNFSGTAPFEYSVNSGAFQPFVGSIRVDTIKNLAPGNYIIQIRDAVGCLFQSQPLTVNAGPDIQASFLAIPTACAAATTGQVVVTPISGVGPFSFSLDNAAFVALSDTIRNLDSGFHSIIIRDALGCAVTINPEITFGTGVAATFTTINSACSAASNGAIVTAITSGNAPFIYSTDGGANFLPLDTIRNLSEGVHNVLIRDAVGCEFASPVTVNSNNPGVGATFVSVNAACAGVSTGQIIITPTIGNAPFSYSTDGGANYFPLDTIRNLASNTYNIRLRDGLGCAYDAPPVTVGNDAGVSATFTTVNSACTAASTGSIAATISAGTSPFSYSIDAGANYYPIDTIRNLSEGSYTVLIRDAVGCQFTAPVTVNSNNPGVGATFVSVNAACAGVSTGQIIITPTIGNAPFSYSTDGGANYFPLDTIRNLAGNTYNIRLRDGLGCAYDAPPVTVGNDIGVTATFATINTACVTVATGAIISSPVTGTPPFLYSMDAGTTYKSDSVFRNLAVNTYSVRVRDAVGCIFDSPAQSVGNNPGVVTSPSTIQNASCASIPNGTITVNVTAGIAPFSYAVISPVPGIPQALNQFTSLFSGSYGISITDSAGCTNTITSIVGNNPKVQIDSFNIVRPSCNGLQNGTVIVNVSLGVAPYQYAIDGGVLSASKIFSSIGAGIHTIRIIDANNCSIDSVISITEPDVLSATIISTQEATCSGNPDGKINATASGGTLPYQFTVDQAATSGFQATSLFDVVRGNYTVTVKDDNGCTASVNATVDSVFTMYLDLGSTTTLCAGATLTLNPTTNPETSTFIYSPNVSLDYDNVKNPVASPTQTTTYSVTATWGICTLTDNITINVLRKPVPNAGNDIIICHDTTTVLTASASNLSGAVNFTWSPANLLDTKADSTEVTVRPQDENTYFVVTVRDEYNCNFAVSDSVLVKMLPPVYAFAGNDTNAVLNKAHQLTATGAGIGGSYIWDYPAGVTLSDRAIGNPTALFVPVPGIGEYSPNDTNYYKLSVTATNAAGCRATDSIKINVFVGAACYVPSAFSPNGDGINDIFKPVNVGVNIEYFKVFNRYGETVFQTNRFRDGWNGFFKGKEQPVGAYVWVFKGKDNLGRDRVEKGTVMLVR